MFQIHLWTGIGLGLYITVICLTGSVLVFRRELMKMYVNRPQISAHAPGPRCIQMSIGVVSRRPRQTFSTS